MQGHVRRRGRGGQPGLPPPPVPLMSPAALDHGPEEQHTVVRAEHRFGGTLRVRHQAADIAAVVDHAGDVVAPSRSGLPSGAA